jgi:hypothetical protein
MSSQSIGWSFKPWIDAFLFTEEVLPEPVIGQNSKDPGHEYQRAGNDNARYEEKKE